MLRRGPSKFKEDVIRPMKDSARASKNIFLIMAIGLTANILLIANPGFFSHDELD